LRDDLGSSAGDAADRSDFGKSAKVFAGLQDAKEAAAAAGPDGGTAARRRGDQVEL
jgi:hypothetical protein